MGTGIPDTAIDAALGTVPCTCGGNDLSPPDHSPFCCTIQVTREFIHDMLQAVEKAWPHSCPPDNSRRDTASTTASKIDLASPRPSRVRFGFGLPDVRA